MMKPSIEQIRNSGAFRLVKELKFSDILMFVFENIRVYNICSIFYFLISILFISVFAGITLFGFMQEMFTLRSYFSILGWGILAGSILIIPFHEGFHAIAFLIIGARKIRFGADFKQMIFYATAEQFVSGKNGFSIVALSPFVIINLICLLIGFSSGIEIKLFIIVLLLFHNIMCIGDFAMLGFFMRNRKKEMYTFDDISKKTAYFYEKI